MQQQQDLDFTVRSPSSWSSRLAAFKSRSVPDSDPRVVECQTALSHWRLKRQLDREVQAGHMSPSFSAAVVAILRGEPAGSGVRR